MGLFDLLKSPTERAADVTASALIRPERTCGITARDSRISSLAASRTIVDRCG